ncbi:MAG TPA: hemerythrin domain-containing protein [Chloroflexota bacterium]|nr:hemerythrin domain-containing protein [Chloroflexota bacterium]
MAKNGDKKPVKVSKAGPPTKLVVGKPGAPDPLAVLRYEHRTLDNLFGQFEARKDHRMARRICSNIRSHSKVEEDFYRGAEAIPELHDRIDKSFKEHRLLEELTQAISPLGDGQALNELMLALQQAVEQHVREEERTVFPVVLKALSKQALRDLDMSLRAAQDNLLESSKAPAV